MPPSESFRLPKEFVPGPHDIICGRGKSCYTHEGNLRLRAMVRRKANAYSTSRSKEEKSAIVSDIADTVRNNSPNGGFVKQDLQGWYEVGAFLAREKISQAFRDVIQTRYKSSTSARRRSRQAMRKSSSCVDDTSATDGSTGRDSSHKQRPSISEHDDSSIVTSVAVAPHYKSMEEESFYPPLNSVDSAEWADTMPVRDCHSLPEVDDIMFTGRKAGASPIPSDTVSMPERRNSALIEAAQTLQSMDDIDLDLNLTFGLQQFESSIDPVPLRRIFQSDEPWERKSVP